jgi:hypothetical protein
MRSRKPHPAGTAPCRYRSLPVWLRVFFPLCALPRVHPPVQAPHTACIYPCPGPSEAWALWRCASQSRRARCSSAPNSNCHILVGSPISCTWLFFGSSTISTYFRSNAGIVPILGGRVGRGPSAKLPEFGRAGGSGRGPSGEIVMRAHRLSVSGATFSSIFCHLEPSTLGERVTSRGI